MVSQRVKVSPPLSWASCNTVFRFGSAPKRAICPLRPHGAFFSFTGVFSTPFALSTLVSVEPM